jgi:hypothetical protein
MMGEARVTFNEEEFIRKGLYNGMEVWVRKEDGYINATRIDPLVRKYLGGMEWPKTVAYWLENEQKFRWTKKDTEEIEEKPKASYTIDGGYKHHQGTYIHPDLIHFVAQWHSIEYAFAVKHVMDAINELNIAKHQEFEKTTHEIIERLTIEKEAAKREKIAVMMKNEDLTVKNQEQAKIIEDTGVPPETAGHLLKIFPDKVEGYFKISANNDLSKILKYTKKFTFPSSMHVKKYTKKYFGIGNSFPNDLFDEVLKFLRALDYHKTEEPPEPRKE